MLLGVETIVLGGLNGTKKLKVVILMGFEGDLVVLDGILYNLMGFQW